MSHMSFSSGAAWETASSRGINITDSFMGLLKATPHGVLQESRIALNAHVYALLWIQLASDGASTALILHDSLATLQVSIQKL